MCERWLLLARLAGPFGGLEISPDQPQGVVVTLDTHDRPPHHEEEPTRPTPASPPRSAGRPRSRRRSGLDKRVVAGAALVAILATGGVVYAVAGSGGAGGPAESGQSADSRPTPAADAGADDASPPDADAPDDAGAGGGSTTTGGSSASGGGSGSGGNGRKGATPNETKSSTTGKSPAKPSTGGTDDPDGLDRTGGAGVVEPGEPAGGY